MDPAIKQRWLSALESGNYAKGRNWLKTNDNRFCCLGVLCDLHAQETGQSWEGRRTAGGGG